MNLKSLQEKGEVAFDREFGKMPIYAGIRTAFKSFLHHHTLSILEAMKEEIQAHIIAHPIDEYEKDVNGVLSTLLTKLDE